VVSFLVLWGLGSWILGSGRGAVKQGLEARRRHKPHSVDTHLTEGPDQGLQHPEGLSEGASDALGSSQGRTALKVEDEQPKLLTLRVLATWDDGMPMAHQGFHLAIWPEGTEPKPLDYGDIGVGGWRVPSSTLISFSGPASRNKIHYQTLSSDAQGRLTFVDLPPGQAQLKPIDSNFEDFGVVADLVLETDQEFAYVAPTGLSFGGRIEGFKGHSYEIGLRAIRPSGELGPMRRQFPSKQGDFCFRGLKPGRYFACLYDTERWRVAKRFAPFDLSVDIFNAAYPMPKHGTVSFQYASFPKGSRLLGSYMEVFGEDPKNEFHPLCLTSDLSEANSCQFDKLPYGDYVLNVRMVHRSKKDREGWSEIALKLPVTIDRPMVEFTKAYRKPVCAWLRIGVGLEVMADSASGDQPAGKSGQAVVDSEATFFDAKNGFFILNGERIPLESFGDPTEARELARALGNRSTGTKRIRGEITVGTADGGQELVQSIELERRGDFLQPIRMELLGQRPFEERDPRVKGQRAELLLPWGKGQAFAKVHLNGYLPQTIIFEAFREEELDILLLKDQTQDKVTFTPAR